MAVGEVSSARNFLEVSNYLAFSEFLSSRAQCSAHELNFNCFLPVSEKVLKLGFALAQDFKRLKDPRFNTSSVVSESVLDFRNQIEKLTKLGYELRGNGLTDVVQAVLGLPLVRLHYLST